MSREIKFRAWDKKSSKMAYSNDGNQEYAWFTNNDGNMICVYTKTIHKLDNIMQYTGLKDKNSKEIYEGDIVKNVGEIDGEEFIVYSEIVFIDGCFMLLEKDCDLAELTVSEMANDVEVVGNIYENPKLLERESND